MRKLFVCVVFVCCFGMGAYAQPARNALVGGTVVHTDGRPPLENAVVLLEDDRIVAVGSASEVSLPEGTVRIDVAGKWIIPGLIDAHVHFFQSGGLYTRPDVIDLRQYVPYEAHELAQIRARLHDTFARYLRAGVTGVADVGGPFWNFEVRALAEETALAPRVAVAGPLVSTYQPDALTTDDPPILQVNTIDEAVALVERLAARQPDLIKIWYIVFPNQTAEDHRPLIEATIAESHRRGIRVAVHATQLETARIAVEVGADVLVHSVQDEEVDDAFLALLRENEVVYTTSLVVLEGYQEALSQQVRLTPEEYAMANPEVASTLFDLRALPQDDLPQRVRTQMANPTPITTSPVLLSNLKRIQEAGVRVAAGTDAGNIGTLHGGALFREFELMAEAGLSPQQILTAATLNGAYVMGRADDLGTLEAGKLADLVVLNADPLADIGNTSDIHLVVKGGVPYAPDDILPQTPVEVVQRQVNAYNARDLEAFLATYSPDVELYNHPNSLIGSGQERMREIYGDLFERTPALHAEIVNRMVMGAFVIDQERVTGLPEGRVIKAVALYEVHDGLIHRVWFVRE